MIISGGYTIVEVASDEAFSDAKTITHLLREGTFVKPGTDTVELVDGKKYSEVKRCELGIRSADVNDSVESVYAYIKNAEELSVPIYFRFHTVSGALIIVKNALVAAIREFNELGKFCAVRIIGAVMNATEEAMFTFISPVLNPLLKIDSVNKLKIGSVHKLRIS